MPRRRAESRTEVVVLRRRRCAVPAGNGRLCVRCARQCNAVDFSLEKRDAWINGALGAVHIQSRTDLPEFDIRRLSRRIDAVVVFGHVVMVIEFKVGEKTIRKASEDTSELAMDFMDVLFCSCCAASCSPRNILQRSMRLL